jgi:hypothetical protein
VGKIDVRKWSGSLVTTVDQEAVIPGDFSVLKNFIYDEAGFPVVRGGRRKWNATAISDSEDSPDLATVSGIYHYRKGWVSGNIQDWIVVYAGRKLYRAEQDGTLIPIFTGLEKDLNSNFTTLRGWMIFSSDSSKYTRPIVWPGGPSSAQMLKNSPHGHIAASYAGRLWVVDRDYPSRICYSEAYEPDGWSDDSGFVYVNPGDGNAISALVPGFGGEMIVFKDGPSGGSTYRLQGLVPNDFAITELSSTIGAIDQKSVSLIGDKDVLFCSRRGIHSLSRTFQFGDLESAFIDVEVANRWRNLNDHQKRRAVAVDDYISDTWWLFVDLNNDGVNDYGWLFNYRRKSPRGNPSVSDVNFGCNGASVVRDARLGTNLFMTSIPGYLHTNHHPEAMDDGVEFTWNCQLAAVDAGDAFSAKAWEQVWLAYDTWGDAEATSTWWADNHWPSTQTMDLNPSNLTTPYSGQIILDTTRTSPYQNRVWSIIHTREGGAALNIGFSGVRGRLRMRGMRIVAEQGGDNVTLPEWMPYTT